VIAILASYAAIDFVVKEKLEDHRTQLQLQISEQEKLLATVAETTARNGADKVTESIVKDCSVTERTDFDTLLSQLDKSLSLSDLTKLERLFGRCGSFYAQRRAVMVAKFEREIEVLEAYVTQLQTISDEKTIEKYQLQMWKELAIAEKKQSELFNTLVQQQDQIIGTLLEGKSPSSIEIREILTSVSETQESLFVASKQAASLRAVLVPL
jgi:hypothetical protein